MIESRKAPLWWHWAPESTDQRFHLPYLIHGLKGFDLTLTSASVLVLTFTEQKRISFDATWREDYDGVCILALRLSLAELWAINQTPTFGSLTWHLRSPVDQRPLILVPIAASRNHRHTRFSLSSTKLREKRRVGSYQPPRRKYVENVMSGDGKMTFMWGTL